MNRDSDAKVLCALGEAIVGSAAVCALVGFAILGSAMLVPKLAVFVAVDSVSTMQIIAGQ